MAITPPPIDPTKLDLNALSELMGRSTQAASQAETLKAQLARANALRGTDYAGVSGDNPSIIGGLRDVLAGYRGGQQYRELTPKYEQAQTLAGQYEPALKLYQQKVTEQNELQRRAEVQQARRNRASPETFINPETKDIQTVYLTKAGGYVDMDGNRVNLDGWKPYNEFAPRGSGYGAGSTYFLKTWGEAATQYGAGNELMSSAMQLSDADFESLDAVGPRLQMLFTRAVAPDFIGPLLAEETSPLTPAAKNFVHKMNSLDAETRHRLFGAALTNNEDATSKDILSAVQEMGIRTALDRIANQMARWERDMRILELGANVEGKTDELMSRLGRSPATPLTPNAGENPYEGFTVEEVPQ